MEPIKTGDKVMEPTIEQVPAFSVRVEKVHGWNQRNEPILGSVIYKSGTNWGNEPEGMSILESGIYIGKNFVARVFAD